MHLRFTVRDLLLLTAVVACVIGWWLDHKHMARELSAFQQEMKIERNEFALYSYLRWQRVDQKQEVIRDYSACVCASLSATCSC